MRERRLTWAAVGRIAEALSQRDRAILADVDRVRVLTGRQVERLHFAELAAPWFETADVVETHHDAKVDAPSGTAMATVERMAAASSTWAPDPTESTVLEGARGGEHGGIRVHSLRVRGMIAHQEVVLGTTGQSLTIRHDSYDRASFMPGVVLAVKEVGKRPGVTVGLDALLGLAD